MLLHTSYIILSFLNSVHNGISIAHPIDLWIMQQTNKWDNLFKFSKISIIKMQICHFIWQWYMGVFNVHTTLGNVNVMLNQEDK